MNERTKQFRVGLVVFSTLIITSTLIILNSDFSSSLPFSGKYQVKMLVNEAPGVAPDTPVRRRGLPIGRVASVEDTDEGALITMNIEDGKQIKTNEVGRIQTSLVGDAVIARPLGLVFTVIGAVTYVVTLPFSLAGGNAGEAGKVLVVGPAEATFVRCLGCTKSGYKRDTVVADTETNREPGMY